MNADLLQEKCFNLYILLVRAIEKFDQEQKCIPEFDDIIEVLIPGVTKEINDLLTLFPEDRRSVIQFKMYKDIVDIYRMLILSFKTRFFDRGQFEVTPADKEIIISIHKALPNRKIEGLEPAEAAAVDAFYEQVILHTVG